MTKWTYAFAINTINLLWRCDYRNTTRLTPKDLRRKKTGTFMQFLVMDAQRCLFLRQSEPLPEQLLLWQFDCLFFEKKKRTQVAAIYHIEALDCL